MTLSKEHHLSPYIAECIGTFTLILVGAGSVIATKFTGGGSMFLQLWKKLAAIGTGFLGTMVLNDSFDYLMYPFMIGLLGPIRGGVIMTVLALGLNYSLVLIYNKTNADWFGFEWLRLQKDTEARTLSGRVLKFALKGGHWPAFLFLSWEDPFKAFVFVRGRLPAGAKFTAADWRLFFEANLLGNLIWITMVSGLLEIIKRVIFG